MIPRERVINKLRELGYSYVDQTKKIQMWRRRGDSHHVAIRRKEDPFSDEYVRQLLKQCGCNATDIDQFIGQCRTH